MFSIRINLFFEIGLIPRGLPRNWGQGLALGFNTFLLSTLLLYALTIIAIRRPPSTQAMGHLLLTLA